MDPTDIDWSARPAEFISEILPDIIFKFTDAVGDDGEVAAHKTVLVMVSRIFRNMFIIHNTLDMSAKEILIEDSRKQPFQIMIDAIYNVKRIKDSLRGKSIDEMFAVHYVVTKYEIRELELAVKECLSTFPITEDNVLEVATNALEYLATFEEVARNVLFSCAKYLEPKFTDAKSFIRYVAENGDKNVTVLKLAELMNDMPPSAVCSNCQESPCLHGIQVEGNQFRVGLKMAKNPRTDIPYFDSEVMEVGTDDTAKIKISVWVNGKMGERLHNIKKTDNTALVFKCKIRSIQV